MCFARSDFSRNSYCSASVFVGDCHPNPLTCSQECPFLSLRCVTITKPFVLALLTGHCRDTIHGFRSDVDCLYLDHPKFATDGLGRYASTYMVEGGFAISGKIDYNDWSRGSYNNVPAISDTEELFMLPIRPGFDFRCGLDIQTPNLVRLSSPLHAWALPKHRL